MGASSVGASSVGAISHFGKNAYSHSQIDIVSC